MNFDADIYIGDNENMMLLKEEGFIAIQSINMRKIDDYENSFSYTLSVMIGNPVLDIGKIIAEGSNKNEKIELRVFFNSKLLGENLIQGIVFNSAEIEELQQVLQK